MKHISKLRVPSLPAESCVDKQVKETFHPMSYYLNGGIDLSGQVLDKSAEVEYDNETQLKELETAGAMSVPYGDPRESKFSLIERYGIEESKMMSAKSPSPTNIEPDSTVSTE